MRFALPSVVVVLASSACASPSSGPSITFDVCSPIRVSARGATSAEDASLDQAIAMWRALGVVDLARADAGATPDVSIEFSSGAPAFHGYYDGDTATVYVNLDLVDPEQRAITIAHELGHSFGLVHVAPDQRVSVMNPGNLTIVPDDGDRIALDAIWGACR